jgi:fermentation-respiration switch protein FrsA (DUF1100 family)
MIVRRGFVAALLVLALALATVQFWIPLLIYRPAPLASADPRAWGIDGSATVRLRYPDGTAMTGWWHPPAGEAQPVVLVIHGRSANIASRAPVMRHLAGEGMGVLMIDFRGYGASSGRPSEGHLREDASSAYRWLRGRGIADRRIVVVGQSLGNAPAAARPVGALVLVSPFTSLPGALQDRFPWLPVRWLPWSRNRFDVSASLKRYRGPTLLVSSRGDGLVPIDNARRLAAGARSVHWLDATPLPHDGMLLSIARDGRLAAAIRSLLPAARHDNLPRQTRGPDASTRR